MLRVAILVDNVAGANTQAEHGLSYLIEYNQIRILFDTGQTDLFLRNAQQMDIDIKDVDYIVLSHGHFDHGNGLNHINGGKLICHPNCFAKRYRQDGGAYLGLKNSWEDISEKFDLTTSSNPLEIHSGAYFLGEIPRKTSFESQTTPFILSDGSPDFILDDSALAFSLKKGVFVITGCGHAGIVNTLEHAKTVTGEKNILGIMGGFHLKKNDIQTQQTVDYLRTNNASEVFPSHCTAEPALALFRDVFASPTLKTGEWVYLEDQLPKTLNF